MFKSMFEGRIKRAQWSQNPVLEQIPRTRQLMSNMCENTTVEVDVRHLSSRTAI